MIIQHGAELNNTSKGKENARNHFPDTYNEEFEQCKKERKKDINKIFEQQVAKLFLPSTEKEQQKEEGKTQWEKNQKDQNNVLQKELKDMKKTFENAPGQKISLKSIFPKQTPNNTIIEENENKQPTEAEQKIDQQIQDYQEQEEKKYMKGINGLFENKLETLQINKNVKSSETSEEKKYMKRIDDLLKNKLEILQTNENIKSTGIDEKNKIDNSSNQTEGVEEQGQRRKNIKKIVRGIEKSLKEKAREQSTQQQSAYYKKNKN